eukprot:6011145-Alexandrium_andersonii.AAC.1
MVFAKQARDTKLKRLPTGHVARCVTEFPSEGWRRPARLRESGYRADPRSELHPKSLPAYKRAAVRRSVLESP